MGSLAQLSKFVSEIARRVQKVPIHRRPVTSTRIYRPVVESRKAGWLIRSQSGCKIHVLEFGSVSHIAGTFGA